MTKYHPTSSIYTFLDVHEVATGPKAGRFCSRSCEAQAETELYEMDRYLSGEITNGAKA